MTNGANPYNTDIAAKNLDRFSAAKVLFCWMLPFARQDVNSFKTNVKAVKDRDGWNYVFKGLPESIVHIILNKKLN